jgi:hypothetical protein
VIRKCVQFCTDRQTVDSNVTGCMFISYWIIKSTDTNWYGDKKMCRVLYQLSDHDSYVTGCMVIAYWIIKSTDTNWYGDKKKCTVLYQ